MLQQILPVECPSLRDALRMPMQINTLALPKPGHRASAVLISARAATAWSAKPLANLKSHSVS